MEFQQKVARFLMVTNSLIHYGVNLREHQEKVLKSGCPCSRERPNCPCPEAVVELKTKGYCLCRVFVTERYFNDGIYLRDHSFLGRSREMTKEIINASRTK